MKLHLRYFASLREALGTGAEEWSSQAGTVGDLRDELIARGGCYAEALARSRTLRASVNQVLVAESAALSDGAEVAFFPPVTGG